MLSLESAQRAIIAAGCLGMAYTQLSMSPATIEFARNLGATGLHIGLLGALPTGMLFMQFVAAVAANHLHYRRWIWFWTSLLQRLVLVPLALGPLIWPEVSNLVWVWALILATATNHVLLHFCTPLWLSWMGDYLPHAGLSHFWGRRHLWMQAAAAVSLLASAQFVTAGDLSMRVVYAVLVGAGAVFGVADILLFLRIEEPPVQQMKEPRLARVLAAPFQQPDFRTFITYACFWNFAAMVGAPFISLYLLDYMGMDLYHVLLLWTFSWLGGAVFSRRLGFLIESYGNRPMLVLCTAFKSLNMIALLLTPPDATAAFWILVPVFMVDALLNAGIAIASNGFMLKNSPAENRTMFIAAGTALAGMIGGLTSVVSGAALASLAWFNSSVGGLPLVNYHLLFAASLLLRLVAVLLARRVTEPRSVGTVHVMTQLIGVTPSRMLRFPVGLYRSYRERNLPDERQADEEPIHSPLREPKVSVQRRS